MPRRLLFQGPLRTEPKRRRIEVDSGIVADLEGYRKRRKEPTTIQCLDRFITYCSFLGYSFSNQSLMVNILSFLLRSGHDT
jgi:hypothetical protein